MLNWINDLIESNALFEAGPASHVSLLSAGLRQSLNDLMEDCRAIYGAAGRRCLRECPERISGSKEQFLELMDDLHRGVLIKTLIEVANCDRRWSQPEKEVAVIVMRHVWGVEIGDKELGRTLRNVIGKADSLRWEELFGPFVNFSALQPDAVTLRALTLRLANLIAKADGQVLPAEIACLEELEGELERVFEPKEEAAARPQVVVASECRAGKLLRGKQGSKPEPKQARKTSVESQEAENAEQREKLFQAAMKELESLIGLEEIKKDVRQLVDFIKIQTARKDHDLPAADISFHAVFEGNPGTGKTTVARIVGRLLAGLQMLSTGQTIEIDRSGLVAQYAGQTGPRTNERIDEAMGGVLFVDEAYSLIPDSGEDMFGIEAVQALLKRMEDDRDKFVVVLAGYPAQMQRMLKSNPGLSSRFQRSYKFPDYSAKDLLRIFYVFCKQYHYRLPKATQAKLLRGFQTALDNRDEHFGNGRLARNLFENALRHMSSRLVHLSPLTRELLSTIEPDDIVF